MTWAVYDGDVPIMLALRSILEWRTTAWWRSRSSWGMTWDPYNVQRWKHKVGFHNRGIQWDTPMARWAGEVKDWIQLMTQTQPRKDDVIRNLLESMKQPVDRKKESKGSVPTKKPRDLLPLDLGTRVPGESTTLEIKGDNKTIVDWMNGLVMTKTRIGTVEKAQNLLRQWWGRGMRLRQRTTYWVTHTFREHNKEADLSAGKGAKGRAKEWVDTTRIAWQEVAVVCRFWDGSYDNGKCGGSIVLMAFSEPHGALYQGIVPWMLKWVDAGCLLTIYINVWKSAPLKRAIVRTIEIEVVSFLPTMHFLVACVTRGWTVTEPPLLPPYVVLEGGSGSGVRRYGGKGTCGIEGLVIQLSK